jgi:hypothetical protein
MEPFAHQPHVGNLQGADGFAAPAVRSGDWAMQGLLLQSFGQSPPGQSGLRQLVAQDVQVGRMWPPVAASCTTRWILGAAQMSNLIGRGA